MLILASIVLLILKVTAFPAIAWWVVALPVVLGIGIWLLALIAGIFGAVIVAKFLD